MRCALQKRNIPEDFYSNIWACGAIVKFYFFFLWIANKNKESQKMIPKATSTAKAAAHAFQVNFIQSLMSSLVKSLRPCGFM